MLLGALAVVARYAWREITAVREERRRGSREVRLLLIDGRAVRLPAPRSSRVRSPIGAEAPRTIRAAVPIAYRAA